MKRVLAFLLLLGAFIGLIGQEAAFAAGPVNAPVAIAKMASTSTQMSVDCMAMMQKAPQPAQKPCKGMTPDCMASMGCAVPAVAVPDAPLLEKMIHGSRDHYPAQTSASTGRALAPEPEPPTHLI